MVDLRDAGGEYLVPEEGDFFLKGRLCVDHAVDPAGLADAAEGAGLPLAGVVAQELVVVDGLLVFRMEELFDGCLVPNRDSSFQLVAGSPEAGASHQVGHQRKVFVGHLYHLVRCVYTGVFPAVSIQLAATCDKLSVARFQTTRSEGSHRDKLAAPVGGT